ncbi:MAG TPA: hypothetical protein VFW33_04225, partial [Gemmataceae bacterium]|nr:hypothetical protein [Gemmataceae bacterium]
LPPRAGEGDRVASCRYHPETPGVGICVRCRTVICADCCTRLQGINHCHECLRALARDPVGRRGGAGSALAATGLLALAAALLFGLLLLAQGRLAP